MRVVVFFFKKSVPSSFVCVCVYRDEPSEGQGRGKVGLGGPSVVGVVRRGVGVERERRAKREGVVEAA